MLAANTVKQFHFEGTKSVTAMGMALLAGVVGDTIRTEGLQNVKGERDIYINEPQKLNWRLGGADKEYFRNNKIYFENQY